MKDYTAIGSMLYGTGGESFKRGILGGVSRTLKAGNSNTTIVLIREITEHEESTEVHPGVEVQPKWLGVPDGGVSPCLDVGQHHGTEPKIVEINETSDNKKGRTVIQRY